MASSISAGTTSATALVHTADTTGELELQTNNGTTALTIDASQNVTLAKGLTVGATAAPAFSAYATDTQSISNATATKIVYDTEDFDTNSNFASNRFTPTVAGYYQINTGLFCAGSSTGGNVLSLYKNGTEYVQLTRTLLSGAFNVFSNGSCLVYCNGSTDYLEIFATQNSGVSLTMGNGSKSGCWFNGAMARSA